MISHRHSIIHFNTLDKIKNQPKLNQKRVNQVHQDIPHPSSLLSNKKRLKKLQKTSNPASKATSPQYLQPVVITPNYLTKTNKNQLNCSRKTTQLKNS